MERMINDKEMVLIRHLFSLGRYEEAAVHISNLLAENPYDSEALFKMAVVYMSRMEYSRARETCQEALEYGYDPCSCYHMIGTTFKYERDYSNAERALLHALEIEPESGELLASYGYLMLLTGFKEKALKLLESALEHEPDSERVNQYVLEYYFATNDSEKQLEFIKNIMDSAGDEQQKLTNLALYHELQGNELEAREYYRQAFLTDPSNQSLLGMLAYYDEKTHPIFTPHRLMKKIGGPAVVWTVFMIVSLLLYYTKQVFVLFTVVAMYLLFVVYTWVAPFLYNWIVKGRNKWTK